MAFFREEYGLTFLDISDDELLDNSNIIVADGFILMPFVMSVTNRFRLYSATAGEQAQFFNVPIHDFGWIMMTTEEQPAAGNKNLTLPIGAFAPFGSYVIEQCPESRGSCPPSILTPNNPAEPIIFDFKAQAYGLFEVPPTNYIVVDCEASHPIWGEGSIHGYAPRDAVQNKYHGIQVVSFPSTRP